MRVVVTGATGNVGTSLVRALGVEPAVDWVLGIARRVPDVDFEKTDWAQADVVDADLASLFAGADAVVHLAWAIQPSHDGAELERINVGGSRRVLAAVAQAGVKTLVYASSVGAYSRGPKTEAVDESWPTNGIPSSFYSRHKAAVERLLDTFEREHPDVRVVRLRPGLIFKREAAASIRRLFTGRALINPLVQPRLIVAVPDIPGLRVQALHSDDAAEAYRLALLRDVSGPFNVAAQPVLDAGELARILGARRVPFPGRAARALTRLSWRAHLQPTPPGWLDLGLGVPVMNTHRARTVLDWEPRFTAAEALLDLLDGFRHGAGGPTPALSAESGVTVDPSPA